MHATDVTTRLLKSGITQCRFADLVRANNNSQRQYDQHSTAPLLKPNSIAEFELPLSGVKADNPVRYFWPLSQHKKPAEAGLSLKQLNPVF